MNHPSRTHPTTPPAPRAESQPCGDIVGTRAKNTRFNPNQHILQESSDWDDCFVWDAALWHCPMGEAGAALARWGRDAHPPVPLRPCRALQGRCSCRRQMATWPETSQFLTKWCSSSALTSKPLTRLSDAQGRDLVAMTS